MSFNSFCTLAYGFHFFSLALGSKSLTTLRPELCADDDEPPADSLFTALFPPAPEPEFLPCSMPTAAYACAWASAVAAACASTSC